MARARLPSVDRDGPATGRVPSGDLAHHGLTLVPTREVVRETMPRHPREQAADLGRALLALAHEQTRHHLELLRALTDAVDWDNRTRMMDWEQILQHQGRVLQRLVSSGAQVFITGTEAPSALAGLQIEPRVFHVERGVVLPRVGL